MIVCDVCGATGLEHQSQLNRWAITMARPPRYPAESAVSYQIGTRRNQMEFDLCGQCASKVRETLERAVEGLVGEKDEATQKGGDPTPNTDPAPVDIKLGVCRCWPGQRCPVCSPHAYAEQLRALVKK